MAINSRAVGGGWVGAQSGDREKARMKEVKKSPHVSTSVDMAGPTARESSPSPASPEFLSSVSHAARCDKPK